MTAFLQRLPLACRMVDAQGRVIWESEALQALLHTRADAGCCESLGFLHRDRDCPSLRTICTGTGQSQMRWLGRVYLSILTVPVAADDGQGWVSFECFQDVSAEQRLRSAFAQQQELLESINKAMIEINHHLETARAELERKNRSLEDANSQLRSLDQLKDEFLTVVSHELKAPLTSIKGSVELIESVEQRPLSDAGRDLIGVCRRNIDRLSTLVQDLLDVARIQSGRLTLGFSRFPMRAVADEALESQRALAEIKGLRLVNSCPEGVIIEADHDRLVQVLVNLVNNGIKYTDHGEVTVEAAVDGERVTFAVTDTGLGIPPADQELIFDRFAQVRNGVHRNAGGTGLGLSIVRGIVREHGGEVRVQSAPGQGSRFTFTIPQPPGRGR